MATDNNDGSADPRVANLRPFPKGVSPNPGGKSPERERLRRYVVEAYGQESIDGIADLARTAKSAKVRLDAWIWIAEQTVGKAAQPHTGEDGGPIKVDIPAIAAKLKKLAGEE